MAIPSRRTCAGTPLSQRRVGARCHLTPGAKLQGTSYQRERSTQSVQVLCQLQRSSRSLGSPAQAGLGYDQAVTHVEVGPAAQFGVPPIPLSRRQIILQSLELRVDARQSPER